MRYLLLCLACAPFIASAQAYKCFDGKQPKYTYQNVPCEDTGLKTAKIITNKDAVVGSADFSGYAREAKERARTSEMLERDHIERRNIEAARSSRGTSSYVDPDECPRLIVLKRNILTHQRYDSYQGLQDRYNVVVKKMQKIDCIGS